MGKACAVLRGCCQPGGVVMAIPFSECLSFAKEHSTVPGKVSTAALEPTSLSSELQYRQAAPLFAADGRSTRLKRTQEHASVLDEFQDPDKAATLVRDETGQRKKAKKKPGDVPATSGASHFDLPNTPMTPELENTFRLLEMRPYIYKQQNYKKALKWQRPSYFGVGTVQDDAKDYYSTRVKRKDRKQSLAAEFLEDPSLLQYVEQRRAKLDAQKAKLEATRHRRSHAGGKSKKKTRVRGKRR